MNTVVDLYADSALAYIELVRSISREAAEAVEQVYVAVGSHAALRVALIIILMKMEVKQNHWLPYIGLYQHLIDDYPAAHPLAEQAMTCCLEAWGFIEVSTGDWTELSQRAVVSEH